MSTTVNAVEMKRIISYIRIHNHRHYEYFPKAMLCRVWGTSLIITSTPPPTRRYISNAEIFSQNNLHFFCSNSYNPLRTISLTGNSYAPLTFLHYVCSFSTTPPPHMRAEYGFTTFLKKRLTAKIGNLVLESTWYLLCTMYPAAMAAAP